MDVLANGETDAATRTALVQIAEKIRYSDPMSSEKLAELEGQIASKVVELKAAADRMAVISELQVLIDEWNKKCKMQKGGKF